MSEDRNGRKNNTVNYDRTEEGCLLAADWDLIEPGRWGRSSKECGEHLWRYEPKAGLDQESYHAVLEHFGLSGYEAHLPMAEVERLSPSQLEKLACDPYMILNRTCCDANNQK